MMNLITHFGKGENLRESQNVDKIEYFSEEIMDSDVTTHDQKAVLVEDMAANSVGLSGPVKRDIMAIVRITTLQSVKEDHDIKTIILNEVTSAFGEVTAYDAAPHIRHPRKST